MGNLTGACTGSERQKDQDVSSIDQSKTITIETCEENPCPSFTEETKTNTGNYNPSRNKRRTLKKIQQTEFPRDQEEDKSFCSFVVKGIECARMFENGVKNCF
ncbi:unnamed protein product [Moneuplotes crassus]|uniref:Uncharacterized protein n=1 Tax=Euplotes crassus TaxID=5936 RepID=A0AAD1XKH9_EUPCR|nr:unnamed protein product [Moneuplotes crassus]